MDSRVGGALPTDPHLRHRSAQQRAVSSGCGYGFASRPYGSAIHQHQHRQTGIPPLSGKATPSDSLLTHARSVSQPLKHMIYDGLPHHGRRSSAAFLEEGVESLNESPDVIHIDTEDEDDAGQISGGEPPSKRVKMTNESDDIVEDGAARGDQVVERTDKAHEILPGSPLPEIHQLRPSTDRLAGLKGRRRTVDAASRRAHGLEAPAIATRVPPPKKYADFCPWNGNHLEDVLSETVIKAGFFDKAPATTQTETSSAKPIIWPALSQKNHTGLQMLSYLYTQVMEKRQAQGKCIAPSTFKPPPRVTVTDTKREAWLRDLANPDIPLRKQSRTIPHGIRGKILMDQCLGKSIPLQRAVWLAKCVGANEMRAFRRKGVNGTTAAVNESKWVREWTLNVEQFLESIVAACGQDGWQAKMQYSVRLAAALYAERLLEMDHYLNWAVSSFAAASLETLPIWTIFIQIYWRDLTKFGRRGRKLAVGTLAHLQRIDELRSAGYAMVRARLQKMIDALARFSQSCLVIPTMWDQYKGLLVREPGASEIEHRIARSLARRNTRLADANSKTATNTRSHLLDFFTGLDAAGLEVNIAELATKCRTLLPEPAKLVAALFTWASTPYRVGIARVYLATSLIAHLWRSGVETDIAVLEYLESIQTTSPVNKDNIQRVVVELVRQGAFSVGRYLQWLISTGMLSVPNESNCAVELLDSLPTAGLPIHIQNTRKTMMVRLGKRCDDNVTSDKIAFGIREAAINTNAIDASTLDIPENLNLSTKFNIAQHLVTKIDVALSLGAFCVIRTVLENFQDITALSQLICMACGTDDSALLATVADTINLYAPSFAAMQKLNDLVDLITKRYSILRTQQALDRTLIRAMIDLTHRVPGNTTFAGILANDLAICEQQDTMAVCSPASDSLITMQASSLDSDAEIDAVFASGNTMDEQLMQRVFTRILQRVGKTYSVSSQTTISRECGWLNQLRSVDPNGFDHLVQDSLRSFLQDEDHSNISPSMIMSLVASGCATLSTFAEMAKGVSSPKIASSALQIFITTEALNSGVHALELYRFRVQQEMCWAGHHDALTTVLRTACDSPDSTILSKAVIDILICCIVARPGKVRCIFEEGSHSKDLQANASRMAAAILERATPIDRRSEPLDAATVIRMADPLSIRFCTGLVRYMKTAKPFSVEEDAQLGDAIMDAFMQRSAVWPQLLEFAGEETNRRIYNWAQDQLLSHLPEDSENISPSAREQFSRCLEVLAIAKNAVPVTDDLTAVSAISEKLKDLERQLADSDGVERDGKDPLPGVLAQMHVLLPLAGLYVMSSGCENESFKQSRCHLLSGLCSLLTHVRLQTQPAALEYLFDLASALSDNLPLEVVEAVRRPDARTTAPDPRIISITGASGTAACEANDTWLALASQAFPSGLTQQQRALSKHPSQTLSSLSRQASFSQQQSQQSQPSQPLSNNSASSPVPQHSPTPAQQQRLRPGSMSLLRQDSRAALSDSGAAEVKMTPFPLRRWELMPDPTPVMGENDTSLSLTLFGARRV